MSLLTIAEGLAKNVGMAIPEQVISSPKREWIEAVGLSNLVGEELARRVDFGELRKTTTLTGTGGQIRHVLPDYFARVSPGYGVTYDGQPLRPLTSAEWGSLTPVAGAPRYYLLGTARLTLWPHLAVDDTVKVIYQSKAFTVQGRDKFLTDSDTSIIDETLFLKGLIVRWRRQKGMDYADYEAEYEATLADIANFDERARL